MKTDYYNFWFLYKEWKNFTWNYKNSFFKGQGFFKRLDRSISRKIKGKGGKRIRGGEVDGSNSEKGVGGEEGKQAFLDFRREGASKKKRDKNIGRGNGGNGGRGGKGCRQGGNEGKGEVDE